MTNREAFTRATRLAQSDLRFSRIVRTYVDRYGVAGMRRLLDAATVDMLLSDLERS